LAIPPASQPGQASPPYYGKRHRNYGQEAIGNELGLDLYGSIFLAMISNVVKRKNIREYSCGQGRWVYSVFDKPTHYLKRTEVDSHIAATSKWILLQCMEV
jgi:hypothetical protein